MDFVSVPYLPFDAGAVLIDGAAAPSVAEDLKSLGIEVFTTMASSILPPPVSGHPDMQIFHMGGSRFICAPELLSYYTSVLSPLGAKIMPGNAPLQGHYPHDCAYNIARVGEYAFFNAACVDSAVLRDMEENGVKPVHIRQGYAKCSVCIVSPNAVITSDAGISRAARAVGIDCLTIRPGHIAIDGYNYGFIGGASGLIRKDTLAFAGDIGRHPDYKAIKSFCDERGVRILPLGSGKLSDIGSIIPIMERK